MDGPRARCALRELVLAELVTNDRFDTLQVMRAAKWGASEQHGLSSSLDRDLAAWRRTRPKSRSDRPPRTRLSEARRRISRRSRLVTGPRGRWVPVRCYEVWGQQASPDERADAQARQLLMRYGLVTRDLLANEDGLLSWGSLYWQFHMMEMRGQVRRGYFVRGLSGVQFALPEAIEQLRAWNSSETEGVSELVLVSACDPALLYGPALARHRNSADLDIEGALCRVSRLPSNYVVLQRGVPVLAYCHGDRRWVCAEDLNDDVLAAAVRLLRNHLVREDGLCANPRRVLVGQWNGHSPLAAAQRSLLESLGFRREVHNMVWDGLDANRSGWQRPSQS